MPIFDIHCKGCGMVSKVFLYGLDIIPVLQGCNSKAVTQMMKAAIRATINFGRCAIKATIAATKTAVAAIKGITAAIVTGGWIVVVVILLLCAVGMAVGQMVGADYSGGELPQTVEDLDVIRNETVLHKTLIL